MKLESGWVPVALSSSIEPGTSAGAVVECAEVVVWRDNSGKAHVWEDRCPHRGMRLSFGFVRGDHIACLYHGWEYDAAGQCRYIPAHPKLDVPQTIKVPIYTAAEKNGVVWATAAAEAAFPAFEETTVTPLRSLYVDAALGEVIAALSAEGVAVSSDNIGTAEIEGREIFVALQVVGSKRTAAHIVVLGDADSATLKRLSQWAEALRLKVESPAFVQEVA